MIELHYWPTPNGHKITIFLEEAGLEYKIVPVNILKGDQFKPEFLQISPNNRMPAIVDHAPKNAQGFVSVFESGAILVYLAEKVGKFLPAIDKVSERVKVMEWLFWQMGGLGPMSGQNNHFAHYAKEKLPYAIQRYVDETARLYRVLNGQLEKHEYVAGAYSIADMAIYPWIVMYEKLAQDINAFPHLKRWHDTMKARPAVRKAYEKGKAIAAPTPQLTEEARNVLFGQR